MHSLIIKAHPREDGFTHQIAKTYQDNTIKKGHTAEILDLYHLDNSQEYTYFVSKNRTVEDDSTKRMQEKIAEADELVWVFPIWWFDAPAKIKNFWDRNFTSGFAFRYHKGGKGWDKLLTGKTTKVYATSGGPSWAIKALIYPVWRLGRFGFVGLRTKKFSILGSFPKRTEKEKEHFLKNL